MQKERYRFKRSTIPVCSRRVRRCASMSTDGGTNDPSDEMLWQIRHKMLGVTQQNSSFLHKCFERLVKAHTNSYLNKNLNHYNFLNATTGYWRMWSHWLSTLHWITWTINHICQVVVHRLQLGIQQHLLQVGYQAHRTGTLCIPLQQDPRLIRSPANRCNHAVGMLVLLPS